MNWKFSLPYGFFCHCLQPVPLVLPRREKKMQSLQLHTLGFRTGLALLLQWQSGAEAGAWRRKLQLFSWLPWALELVWCHCGRSLLAPVSPCPPPATPVSGTASSRSFSPSRPRAGFLPPTFSGALNGLRAELAGAKRCRGGLSPAAAPSARSEERGARSEKGSAATERPRASPALPPRGPAPGRSRPAGRVSRSARPGRRPAAARGRLSAVRRGRPRSSPRRGACQAAEPRGRRARLESGGMAARSQASLRRRLQSSQEAQHRQAVLVRKLQAKVRSGGACPGGSCPGPGRGGGAGVPGPPGLR